MTDDQQYWSAIKHHYGLTPTTHRAGHMILCRTRDNTTQFVTDPASLTPDERMRELKNLALAMDLDPPSIC